MSTANSTYSGAKRGRKPLAFHAEKPKSKVFKRSFADEPKRQDSIEELITQAELEAFPEDIPEEAVTQGSDASPGSDSPKENGSPNGSPKNGLEGKGTAKGHSNGKDAKARPNPNGAAKVTKSGPTGSKSPDAHRNGNGHVNGANGQPKGDAATYGAKGGSTVVPHGKPEDEAESSEVRAAGGFPKLSVLAIYMCGKCRYYAHPRIRGCWWKNNAGYLNIPIGLCEKCADITKFVYSLTE